MEVWTYAGCRPFFLDDTQCNIADRISVLIDDLDDFSSDQSFELLQQTERDSMLYRKDRTYLLKRFSANNRLRQAEWITAYNSTTFEACSYTNPLLVEPGVKIFPSIGSYPHFQFLLTAYLALHHGSLHHCACAVHNGKAYIFAGRSGIGKSTMSRLLDASGAFRVIGDDRIVVRHPAGNSFTAYGTPWPSTAGFAENASAPLGGIFFLHQSKTNRIEPISSGAAFKQLLPVSDIPWYDQLLMDGILKHCEQMAESVPVWDVFFRPDPDIVTELLNRMD